MNKSWKKKLLLALLLLASLSLSGCSGNVGVGMSVGVPIGNHGYMSVGTGRWL
jgi:predicted small secreted protein